MEKLISVIVPTYNERENVQSLVQRTSDALADRAYEMVFVDDDSPDGTAGQIATVAADYPVKVLIRKNETGLASAVVHGLSQATGDIIVVMDADLQHPPEAIKQLLREMDGGADIAIASRYVPGGEAPGLSWLRKRMSKAAISVAHLLLPMTRSIKDPMSGFFVFDRKVVGNTELRPTGFKILLEILTMGNYEKVVQLPIVFGARSQGNSKFSLRPQIEYLKHVFSLMGRAGEMARFIKFCVVGLSGVGVNSGLLWLLTEKAGFFYVLSAAISIEASIISNFMFNNFFTFSDRRPRDVSALLRHLARFNVVSLVGVCINLGVLWLLTSGVGIYYLASNCVGIALATLWNYLENNWWTWKT